MQSRLIGDQRRFGTPRRVGGPGELRYTVMTATKNPEQWDEIARWVRAAQNGSEDAFRRLLEHHRRAISLTLFACGIRCEATAEDLAQDVALRAWTRLGGLADARAFPAWIRRVAANAARDHLRRAAVRKEESLEIAVTVESDDDPFALTERVAEVRLMLAAIETEDAETIDLLNARADGVPIADLAKRKGIAEAAMKMRLMRIRKRLRKRLDELRSGKGSVPSPRR